MSQFTSMMSEDLQTSILASNNCQPDQSGDKGYHLKIVYISIANFASINWNHDHINLNNMHMSV